MHVLYISDSLGTPIHPRGIFNFSVSFVEILKGLGATVDLVVEGADNFGLEGRYGALSDSAPDAVNAVRLSEIHRYFAQSQFGFRWGYHSPHVRTFAAKGRALVNAWLDLRDRLGCRPSIVVRNGADHIDFTPPKSEHLGLFDSLVLKRGFYSASMSRANLGFGPVGIDASGYDVVVVDTPHFIRVGGIASDRILTVVHDLIPLRDPTMDLNWRNLFMRKLEAMLAMRGNLAFVSCFTQKVFHMAFPHYAAPNEFIFHPAIRKKLAKDAEQGCLKIAAVRSARHIAKEDGARRSARLALVETAPAPANDKKSPAAAEEAQAAADAPPPGWDAALPYFVTVASDEPRKNIGLIVKAFNHLRGRANVVILGKVEAKRYSAVSDANVHFPGYVDDARKVAFFKHAHGVLFASLAEGFGIPLIEGAVMEMPVICSDIEVFREVAEEQAYYFDPKDAESLASAVDEVLAEPDGARRRAARFRRVALARFSQEAVGETVRKAFLKLGALADEAPAQPSARALGVAKIGQPT